MSTSAMPHRPADPTTPITPVRPVTNRLLPRLPPRRRSPYTSRERLLPSRPRAVLTDTETTDDTTRSGTVTAFRRGHPVLTTASDSSVSSVSSDSSDDDTIYEEDDTTVPLYDEDRFRPFRPTLDIASLQAMESPRKRHKGAHNTVASNGIHSALLSQSVSKIARDATTLEGLDLAEEEAMTFMRRQFASIRNHMKSEQIRPASCPVCYTTTAEGAQLEILKDCNHVVCSKCVCQIFAAGRHRELIRCRCPMCMRPFARTTRVPFPPGVHASELDIRGFRRSIDPDSTF